MHIDLKVRSKCLGLPLFVAVAAFAMLTIAAQTRAQGINTFSTAGAATVTIQRIPIQHIAVVPPNSGQDNYFAYCATCHGATGKGDGPAVSALRQKPTDLTLLAARNKGKFPALSVKYVLTVNQSLYPHAPEEMPNWCVSFRSLDRGDLKAMTDVRVHNLMAFLEKMQVPAH